MSQAPSHNSVSSLHLSYQVKRKPLSLTDQHGYNDPTKVEIDGSSYFFKRDESS